MPLLHQASDPTGSETQSCPRARDLRPAEDRCAKQLVANRVEAERPSWTRVTPGPEEDPPVGQPVRAWASLELEGPRPVVNVSISLN